MAGSPAELATPAAGPRSPARELLPVVIPALLVGIGSGLALIGLTVVANALEDVLWISVPAALGLDAASPGWIFATLTLTGLAVGVVVTLVPGHAGPDPATTDLTAPPLPAVVLPGLALAVALGLGGGVSLGPENPLIAINIGLAVAIGLRVFPSLSVPDWMGLAVAGTVGAMFGTPIAAALLLSEMATTSARPLWDRLFGPLVAASAGAMTVAVLAGESFVLDVAPYGQPALVDLLTGSLVAVASAIIGMGAIYAFPIAHAAFQRLRSPIVALVAGGAILGVIGAIGGPITLFKGLDQMRELTADPGAYTPVALAFMAGLKLVAVVIASTAGFRGGRIFPSIFAAVALGLFAHAAIPQIPEAVALAGSLVGVLVAVTRSGWLAIFIAALLVGDPAILPLVCIIVLPAWLVVTGRPEMIIEPTSDRSGVDQRPNPGVATRA